MITTLIERVAALPAALRERAESIFFIERTEGRAVVPPRMAAWVAPVFGSVEAVERQVIVRVVNRLTLEATLFNPLRALRPAGAAASEAEIEAWLAGELASQAFFADPLHETTADLFGRVEGRFATSASNVAKYDGWHGLVIFHEPHPLRFGRDQVADYLDVALRWLAAAHAQDPLAIYPMITWNCMPKSGATIAHGHMQVALARGMHYARPESWRRAAASYRAATGEAYFDALRAIHEGLGLGLPERAGVRAFAHLTPLRGREVVLLAHAGDEGRRAKGEGFDALHPSPFGDLAERLADALTPILRGLIDGMGVRSFNVGVALPPLAETAESWAGVPIVARVVERGNALTYRNDWGAMELFANGCVTADPFEVAGPLQQRSGE